MSFNVIPSDKFKKEAKKLIRKFPSLKNELRQLSKTLSENPKTGKPLGNGIYKIRLGIRSKGWAGWQPLLPVSENPFNVSCNKG